MEFEPLNEEVNADLNGLQLDPMLQVQRDQFLAEQDAEQTEVEEESTPTGAQAPPQPTQATSTEGAEDQKWPWEEGYDVGDYVRNTAENAFAAQTGMLDFGVDVINKLSGQNFNKLPEFQAQHSQALREISSVVLPTIGLTRLGMSGGVAAHGRVGWSLGNSAFVKWIGTKGVEALAGLGVGAVSSEYEEDNLTGTLKQKWPRQFDFIPDSLATVQGLSLIHI